MSGPDIAGLYAALAKVPGRSGADRRADRRAGAVHATASAMKAGRRYRTRSLPGAKRYVSPQWREQARCERGHYVGPRECRACAA